MPTFTGTTDNDLYFGDGQSDQAFGMGGDDELHGAGGGDMLAGGAGSDVLNGGDGNDTLYSGDQSPEYRFPYYGNPWNAPLLDTGTDRDFLYGGDGSDLLFAGYGDTVDGGAGSDSLYISFQGATAGITLDMRLATNVIGGATISNVEILDWFEGSNFDDVVYANGASGYRPVFFGMGGNDLMVAGYYTNILDGGDGNDVLDGRSSGYMQAIYGGAGDDIIYDRSNYGATLEGGDGNDTIYANVSARGGAGNDLIILQSTPYSTNVTYGDAGDDEIRAVGSGTYVGGDGADTLKGSGGVDILYAANSTAGATDDMGLERDVLLGFGGNDQIWAGYGDEIDGGAGVDDLRLSLGGMTSGITLSTAGIVSGQPFTLGGGVISNMETLSALRGTNFADTLTLATQGSQLIVDAGDGDDVVIATGSTVRLNGGAGNDRFVSGIAGDVFDGGAGSDTIDYSGYASGVTAYLAAGTGAGGDQFSNVENLIGSGFDDMLGGDNGANLIDGGAGVDTVSYLATQTRVTVNLSLTGQQNTLGAGPDTLIGIENLVGTNFGDVLTGDAQANALTGAGGVDVLDGGAGDDLLDGGSGADTMTGGAGNDIYVVDSASDVVIEVAGGGYDTVRTSVAYTLGAAVEAGFLTGTVALNLTGNDLDNILVGNSAANVLTAGVGADTLTGGGGSDTLYGGAGSDTADYSTDGGAAGIIASLGGGTIVDTHGATDFLYDIENLTGSGQADTMTGNAQANRLDGRGANDALFGGDGADVLNGDDGADTLVGNAQVFVAEADTLNGGAGDDLIYGEAVDTINGGAGRDSLIAVNAFSFALDMASSSIEYAVMDFGADIITAAGQTVRVDVFASGGDDQVTGSAFDDLLFGGSGDDIVAGGQGADAIVGEAGIDSLSGGDGDDRIYFDAQDSFVAGGAGYDAGYITAGTGGGVTVDLGGASLEFIQDLAGGADTLLGATLTQGFSAYAGGGADVVSGSAFADVLWGEAGDDQLSGAGGADVLVGGAGGDTLNGGVGLDSLYGGAADGVRDTFVFHTVGAADADAIYEFELGIDKLDLSVFAGNSAANVQIVEAAGSSAVYLNGQQICVVVGVVGLTAGDFLFAGSSGAPAGEILVSTWIEPETAWVQPGVMAAPEALASSDSMTDASMWNDALRPAWTQGPDSGWLVVLV